MEQVVNKSLKSWSNETMELAERFQKDCHQIVETIYKEMESEGLSYQDAVNIFIFNKLAELQIQIDNLKKD